MTPEELSNYKKIYFDITVSSDIVEKQWDVLMPRLPEQESKIKYYRLIPYGAAFLTTIIIFLIGTVSVSLAAKPGDPLYPVKEFTAEITTKITSVFHTITKKAVPAIIPSPSNIQNTEDVRGIPSAKPKGSSEQKGNNNSNNGNGNGDSKTDRGNIKGATSENKANNNSENANLGNSEEAKLNKEEKADNTKTPQSNNPNSQNNNGNNRGNSENAKSKENNKK